MASSTADQTPEQAVISQVEFYLSDSNLPFDKYLFTLWATAHESPENAVMATDAQEKGWLPLEKICSFKRMRPYLEPAPAGLDGIDGVAKALEKSDQVQVKEFKAENEASSGWYVKRKHELKRPEDTMARSVYVKGFPTFDEEPSSETVKKQEEELQKKLEAWARGLDVGQVKSVRMRRANPESGPSAPKSHGKFKGSIFVEFASKDSVEKFLALDPKPEWDGKPLETKSKADYVEEKRKIYAPDSAPGSMSAPKPPQSRGPKPFNAWADDLISSQGLPKGVPSAGRQGGRDRDDRKRKADSLDDNEPDEREILFDGVRFTARKPNGRDSKIEIVDVDKVGTGEGEWPSGRGLYFTLAKKDGSFESDETETGEALAYKDFKQKIATTAAPSFVQLNAASAAAKSENKDDRDAASQQAYPVKGQISFREVVSDETFDKLKQDVDSWQGRAVRWERMSPEAERTFMLARAQFHSEQAFIKMAGSGSGGRGGRGGGRGGRGGRGGGRGGSQKRQRRD